MLKVQKPLGDGRRDEQQEYDVHMKSYMDSMKEKENDS